MTSLATLQPVAASDEVLATVAHELRQPLSSIESIAYYLTMVLPKDNQKIQAQLERIRDLVHQTNEILSNRLAGCVQHSSPDDPSACSPAVDPAESR